MDKLGHLRFVFYLVQNVELYQNRKKDEKLFRGYLRAWGYMYIDIL